MPHCHHAYISSYLVSDSYHITFMICSMHVSLPPQQIAFTTKTVIGKIGDWYQAYCTTYKTHTMITHHGGAGCPLDRALDILTEDLEHTDINNGSTHSSDATVALGGPEKVGHHEDPAYNGQDRLKALTREINDFHQRVAAEEGQSVETLDHWLIDIEMAADLTSESRARLAKVKS